MKLKATTQTEKLSSRGPYKNSFEIKLNNKRVFQVKDADEKVEISDNFNEVHKIPELMKLAHTAGLNGENFEVKWDTIQEI